ncbi:MAG TPA: hypothetical protein VNL98_06565, partial [Gemmatimonadales bacterium]|nr:hypothetical protein [Gemmatimonadales bacterium]
ASEWSGSPMPEPRDGEAQGAQRALLALAARQRVSLALAASRAPPLEAARPDVEAATQRVQRARRALGALGAHGAQRARSVPLARAESEA